MRSQTRKAYERLVGGRFVGVLVVGVVGSLIGLGVVGAPAASASPTPPTLGKATPFAVLAGTTVTNTGPTVISGDLGVDPGSAVTGFTTSSTKGTGTVVNGTQYKATSVALTAQHGLTTAYTNAKTAPSTQTVTGKNLSGMSLTSGVYTSSSNMTLTGTLTLVGTANSVFIFQAGSTLSTGSGSSVVLSGGVQPCNVFWQVSSSATLKTTSKFVGTILASTSASLTKGVAVTGRVLAKTGAVTLLSDKVTESTCSSTATSTTSSTTPTTVASTSATTVASTTVTTTASPTATTAPVAVVPATHTGEPWSGWLYWLIIALIGAGGFVLLADRARRRHLGRQAKS
jgi:hypothetical protein